MVGFGVRIEGSKIEPTKSLGHVRKDWNTVKT